MPKYWLGFAWTALTWLKKRPAISTVTTVFTRGHLLGRTVDRPFMTSDPWRGQPARHQLPPARLVRRKWPAIQIERRTVRLLSISSCIAEVKVEAAAEARANKCRGSNRKASNRRSRG